MFEISAITPKTRFGRYLEHHPTPKEQTMAFRDSMADNVKALRIWHEEHHHTNNWATCVHSPCNVTTPTFRANWDQQ